MSAQHGIWPDMAQVLRSRILSSLYMIVVKRLTSTTQKARAMCQRRELNILLNPQNLQLQQPQPLRIRKFMTTGVWSCQKNTIFISLGKETELIWSYFLLEKQSFCQGEKRKPQAEFQNSFLSWQDKGEGENSHEIIKKDLSLHWCSFSTDI